MKIKKIYIENVLSYNQETIELNNDLNIFVGANGSGKSNLINILIYMLKKYCYKNFEISNNYGIERAGFYKYSIREKNPLYNSSENFFLQKHKKMSNKLSLIDLTLQFEQQDINNLLELKKYQDAICEFIDRIIDSVNFLDDKYQVPIADIKQIFEVEPIDLNINTDIIIKIRENKNIWTLTDCDHKYNIYMKYFSLFCNILDLMNLHTEIKNPFVFFEAYRNNTSDSTRVSISELNNQGYTNLQSWQNLLSLTYSIGTNSTYIMLATKKYGRIMRNCIEEIDGLKKFNELEEYKFLKQFFLKFEYDINLKCIDRNNNIYQFYIKRDNLEVEIDTISSGEREVINFIFGLFLEKLKDGIVIIDEPELHLHPSWQKKLIQILKQETENQNIQILFVTHSSSFISYNVLNNIFRIYKDKSFSRCLKINDLLQEESGNDIRKKLSVINSTNNEKIFFSKNVILVEGITDEILFKKIYESEFNKLEEDLEFININGKNNYNTFASVLEKLKIKYFFIGDYDNIFGFKECSKYFEVDSKKLIKDFKSKNTSYCCLDFLQSTETFLSNPRNEDNLVLLNENYNLCRQYFLKNKKKLSLNEECEIVKFIEEKYLNNFYILKNGEIEDYLESGTHNKAVNFENVIEIVTQNENYQKFTMTKGFTELKEIIHDIHKKLQ